MFITLPTWPLASIETTCPLCHGRLVLGHLPSLPVLEHYRDYLKGRFFLLPCCLGESYLFLWYEQGPDRPPTLVVECPS